MQEKGPEVKSETNSSYILNSEQLVSPTPNRNQPLTGPDKSVQFMCKNMTPRARKAS